MYKLSIRFCPQKWTNTHTHTNQTELFVPKIKLRETGGVTGVVIGYMILRLFLCVQAEAAMDSKQSPMVQRNSSFATSHEVWKYICELGISKVRRSHHTPQTAQSHASNCPVTRRCIHLCSRTLCLHTYMFLSSVFVFRQQEHHRGGGGEVSSVLLDNLTRRS